MNDNGKDPMDREQGNENRLGYCYGYKNAGSENEKRFRQNVEYTKQELLNLRKITKKVYTEMINK